MIQRSSKSVVPDGSIPTDENVSGDFYRQKLKEALGEGVEALKDPEIEAKVQTYFSENPDYSRDAAHVAAIACRFKKEKVAALSENKRSATRPTKIRSP
ncbi:MAG TPA: hypothetical protein VHC44_02935 [Verrucomicrobiae bacterium]|nr:hypothetical protein [Verrucomicrobiae bacterium]